MAIAPAPPFQCEISVDGKCATVVLSGELDIATTSRVGESIDRLVRAGFFKVTVDLSRLAFIDSTGLNMLLAADREAAEAGCAFGLVQGPGAVHRAFQLTGLDSKFAFERPAAPTLVSKLKRVYAA